MSHHLNSTHSGSYLLIKTMLLLLNCLDMSYKIRMGAKGRVGEGSVKRAAKMSIGSFIKKACKY